MTGIMNGSANGSKTSLDTATIQAHALQFQLLTASWTTHFKALDYVKETTMDMLDKRVLRAFAELTMKNGEARHFVGVSQKTWTDMREVFHFACPSLEQRSYGSLDPMAAGYDGPSSNVIVANSLSLLKDLQRLDNMLAIARNLLTAGDRVQNLAAQVGFDREVCALINLCIKITARGYDGDGTAVDEDKWQGVINGFKKLLITCLQFLSNLVTMNERLKLMLWVELFDNYTEPLPNASLDQQEQTPQQQQSNGPPPSAGLGGADRWVRTAVDEFKKQHDVHPGSRPLPNNHRRPPNPYHTFVVLNKETIREGLQQELGAEPTQEEIMTDLKDRWQGMSEDQRAYWKNIADEKATAMREKAEQKTAYETQRKAEMLQYPNVNRRASSTASEGVDAPNNGTENRSRNGSQELVTTMETATDGQRKLHEGKVQLLKRLQAHGPLPDRSRQQTHISPASPIESPISPVDPSQPSLDPEDEEDEDELDDDEEEDERSEDEDYAIPGEDGRGLLTDVPLILGPNEIEVLPMLIMSGIVAPTHDAGKTSSEIGKDHDETVNMYTIRCHLLLAQDNGRNLLRELLIFVAAWDLREEELYFKFMVKIMEAILVNGLMPFAYGAFKESKDIISPAQAVIMKLLTKIFHSRHGFVDAHNTSLTHGNSAPSDGQPTGLSAKATPLSPPVRYDVQIVHCLFSEFRQTIIPQICALIFLQGQIRVGHAGLDDFPLNLWDMERMYEGVYQYLEFFAILTDHEEWKKRMAEWEVVCELLTLLNELEVAIPKGRGLPPTAPPPPPPPPPPQQQIPQQPPKASSPEPSNGPKPVAVERPYDVHSPGNGLGSSVTPSTQPANSAATPTAPPANWPPQQPPPNINPLAQDPTNATSVPPVNPATPSPLHDEPADFEWRNLKKLSILVLSSLVWKNPVLQDQVRFHGGITTILACCAPDEHNPYIREHAIMCLRFLLEGNTANVQLVQDLARIHGSTGPDAPFPQPPSKRTKEWGRKPTHLDIHKDDWLWSEALGHDEIIDHPSVYMRMQEDRSVERARAALPPLNRMPEFTVPDEVLDANGYETFVDVRGQVGLRKKDPKRRSPAPGEKLIDPNARLQIWQPSFNGKSEKHLENIARSGGGIAVGSPPMHSIRSRTPPSTFTFEPRLGPEDSSPQSVSSPNSRTPVQPSKSAQPTTSSKASQPKTPQATSSSKIPQPSSSSKTPTTNSQDQRYMPPIEHLSPSLQKQLDSYISSHMSSYLSSLPKGSSASSTKSPTTASSGGIISSKPYDPAYPPIPIAEMPLPPSIAQLAKSFTSEDLQNALGSGPELDKLKRQVLLETMAMNQSLKHADETTKRYLERMKRGEKLTDGEAQKILSGVLGQLEESTRGGRKR